MDLSEKKRYEFHVFAAFLLFLCMGVIFAITSQQIHTLAMDSCFRILRQSTQQLCRELYKDVENSRKELEMTANYIAGFEEIDAESTRQLLQSYNESGLLSRLEILFPDHRLLQPDGTYIDASEILSYEQEASSGAHISSRQTALEDSEKMILRCYAPIIKNGQTLALLCGVIDLEKLSAHYPLDAFFQKARLYVIEGTTGNFLVDTIHPSLGNIHSLRGRQEKTGYDSAQVASDLRSGKAGTTAFFSTTFDEYLYCDYAPAGINDWMVMFSLPESIALASAKRIRLMLCILALLEAAGLSVYFICQLSRLKKVSIEKENELNRVQYMLDIEGTLLGAARNPGLIEEALHKVAHMLTAEGSFLLVNRNMQKQRIYIWQSAHGITVHPWRKSAFAELCPSLIEHIHKKQGLLSYTPHAIPQMREISQRFGMQSLMMVPVTDTDGAQAGILGAANMQRRWKNAALLESVTLSFLMAINTMESFRSIKEMGMLDHLTGLLNRNCFQKAMERHEKNRDDSLACIYVDADGLHQLNNERGHSSGDQMLKTVAEALKTEFGTEDTYRIGGDEFVAFSCGLQKKQVLQRVQHLKHTVLSHGYHISVGVEWRRAVPLVFELVKQAESKMYSAKRRYYEETDTAQQVRESNWQLEELLTEKRDLDVFRSVLASKYRGVYIVNLSLDTMRPIYIPSYFEKAMQAACGKFSEAIKAYIPENVLPDYHETFFRLVDYEQIQARLDCGEEPELCYQKKDGSFILLRIYHSPEYSQQMKECIWSFENIYPDT